ncbi:hypothetical protein PssiTeo3_04240 [Pseudomonas sichuanensis]|nr:hypothetical protein [Pseudomonas sichuanensis]
MPCRVTDADRGHAGRIGISGATSELDAHLSEQYLITMPALQGFTVCATMWHRPQFMWRILHYMDRPL